jgi:hypothetical protein
MTALNAAVRKIGTLYIGYKLNATDAAFSLHALGIPDTQATEILAIWTAERAPETRLPTISELGAAVRWSVIDAPTAIAKAQLLGYTAYDAWLILGAIAQKPLGTAPPDTDTGIDV